MYSSYHASIQSSGSRPHSWFRAIIAISCGLLIPHLAAAAEKGPYLGVSIGYSNLNGSVNDINSFSGIANPSETTLSSDGSAYSLFGGYRFSQYFALEYGIEHLGAYDYHIGYRVALCPTFCAPVAFAPGDYTMAIYAHKLQARGSWPVSNRWTLDAAAGAALAPTTSDDPFVAYADSYGIDRVTSTFNLLMNAGASLKLSRRWWTRLEFSYLASSSGPPMGSGEIQTFRLSAEYRFFGD
jgi:hypothetical protein